MRVLQGRDRCHKQNERGQEKHLQDLSRGLALVWTESHNRAIAWDLYLFLFILPFGTAYRLGSFSRR